MTFKSSCYYCANHCFLSCLPSLSFLLSSFELCTSYFLDSPNDFIHSYLTKIEESTLESSFHATLGFQNLRSSILDLLLAGSETTSTALSWATLFMIRYPEIQKRVQQEIDQVIGRSRMPEVSDRYA